LRLHWRAFRGPDSFVVGIHGKWGSGKSSLLNLLTEQIDENKKKIQEAEAIHVMRFNPWNFSDQHQLIFQFLRQFRAHLKDNRKEFKDFINSIG
jgi:predicted KAP-like P-loop ATPase